MKKIVVLLFVLLVSNSAFSGKSGFENQNVTVPGCITVDYRDGQTDAYITVKNFTNGYSNIFVVHNSGCDDLLKTYLFKSDAKGSPVLVVVRNKTKPIYFFEGKVEKSNKFPEAAPKVSHLNDYVPTCSEGVKEKSFVEVSYGGRKERVESITECRHLKIFLKDNVWRISGRGLKSRGIRDIEIGEAAL